MMLANVSTKTIRDGWVAFTIAAAVLGSFLLFAMASYRDLDLSVYTDLPEEVRASVPQTLDCSPRLYWEWRLGSAAVLPGRASPLGCSYKPDEEYAPDRGHRCADSCMHNHRAA